MKEIENVKMLYYSDYWDGPLTGLCEYENKYYWYDNTIDDEYDEENEEWKPRVYNLKEIEPWQLSYELYWHSLFVTNVAAYTEFDKQLINDRFIIDINFYKKKKKEYKKIDYSKNKIIGTFKK